MKYNKKDIRKWIEALRSGKYKQGKANLQSADGFCCLGVACDIFIPDNKKILSVGRMTGGYPDEQPHAPQWLQSINDDFAEKTLLVRKGYMQRTSLSNMNDNLFIRSAELEHEKLNMNFDEIADMIQLVYLEGAFDDKA